MMNCNTKLNHRNNARATGNTIIVKSGVKLEHSSRDLGKYNFPLREAATQNISMCLGHTTLRIELRSNSNSRADVKRG
jgi:hypothetical protein